MTHFLTPDGNVFDGLCESYGANRLLDLLILMEKRPKTLILTRKSALLNICNQQVVGSSPIPSSTQDFSVGEFYKASSF